MPTLQITGVLNYNEAAEIAAIAEAVINTWIEEKQLKNHHKMTRKEELQAELDRMDTVKFDLELEINAAKMQLHFLKKRRKLVQEELDMQCDVPEGGIKADLTIKNEGDGKN